MTGVFFSFNSIRLKPDVPLQKLQLSVLTETQHLICHPVTKLEEIVEPTLKIFKAEQVSRSHPRATTSIADTGLERCTRGAIEPTKTHAAPTCVLRMSARCWARHDDRPCSFATLQSKETSHVALLRQFNDLFATRAVC